MFPQLGCCGDTVHFRHHNVHQDQLNVMIFHDLQRLFAGVGLEQTVIFLRGQINLQRGNDVLFVVANQNIIHNGSHSPCCSLCPLYQNSG